MPAGRVAGMARNCAQIVVDAFAASLLDRRPADRCLHEICRSNHQLGSRDRRIISETLFSMLRWWGWLQKLAPAKFLDAWHSGTASRDVSLPPFPWYGCMSAAWLLENRLQLPPPVMHWFREVGLYPELLDGLPADAPVPERRKCLRHFFKGGDMPAMAIEELLPAWIDDELPDGDSLDRRQLIEWFQKRPPVWIRAQCNDADGFVAALQKQSEGAVKPLPHPVLPHAYCVRHASANLRGLKAFQDGLFEVQDLASQAVAFVCDPRPGDQWWDACAGGGGKTLHLAQLMHNRGTILATDLRAEKLEEVKLRARRGHFNNIRMKQWNGKSGADYRDRFDGVLVDVPCSCSGTWRRTPDGRWNTTREKIAEFAALQGQILNAAAEGVKPGGKLVYSTCSMFRSENQGVVESFLQTHPDFILLPHDNPLTAQSAEGMTQIWPWPEDNDAMFTALMVRRKKTQAD